MDRSRPNKDWVEPDLSDSRETGLSECGPKPVRGRKPHSDKRTSQYSCPLVPLHGPIQSKIDFANSVVSSAKFAHQFEDCFKRKAVGPQDMLSNGCCHAVEKRITGTKDLWLQNVFCSHFVCSACADRQLVGKPS